MSPCRPLAILLLVAVAGGVGAQTNSSSEPVVNLGYASFRGTVNKTFSVTTYFGLRYAQPPVGELRFRGPRPIQGSNYYDASSVVDATKPGPACIQGIPGYLLGSNWPRSLGSEDCLIVDVVVPSNPVNVSACGLPVLVQIHGGGYTLGQAEVERGYALVNQSKAIVYVAIQYRLAAFGFLGSVEVRENGDANAGLLDQRAGLDWIQQNIRAFGGDPSKVTIIGGSAGGGSVMNQMIMYGGVASPPFRAAIAEYPWWQPYHNDTVLGDQYRDILAAANCSNLACLRSVDCRVLDAASQTAQTDGFLKHKYYGHGDFYYGPAIDGEVIRELPSDAFKMGHFTQVPLMIDRNAYEGYIFSNQSQLDMDDQTADFRVLFPYARDSFFTRLYQLYPRSAFNSTFFQRQQVFGDFIINCPTYYMSTASADSGSPTWKLLFNAGDQLHGATVPFLFSADPSANNNATLAYIMKDWFLSFVIHLDPNAQSFSGVQKPYWPRYHGDGARGGLSVMDVNYTVVGAGEDRDASAQCDFFHGQSFVVRN